MFNVVHVADGKIHATHGPPRYVEGALAPTYLDIPGPVHHWENPWPLLDDWCAALASSPGTTVTQFGGRWVVRSADLGLSLEWSGSLQLLVVEVERDGLRTRVEFDGYRASPAGDGDIPGSMRRTFVLDPDDPAKARSDEWKIEEVKFNSPGASEALAWNPAALGIYRYEPATGNVYAADGELMYNESEWVDNALGVPGAARLIRRWLVPGLLGIGAISLAVAYRRRRTRG